MSNDVAEAIARARSALEESAKESQRARQQARRAARRSRAAIAELDAVCKEHGIELLTKDTDQGGQSHG